ncbi:hypothetical protein FRC12_020997 [Ceratobasidium sp. 428]|nr:hypothetical protein FRC12_020997 [Ceratobasidium sp. 428]
MPAARSIQPLLTVLSPPSDMAALLPQRYILNINGDSPDQVLWLQAFDIWASQQRANPAWMQHERAGQSPRWTVTLRPPAWMQHERAGQSPRWTVTLRPPAWMQHERAGQSPRWTVTLRPPAWMQHERAGQSPRWTVTLRLNGQLVQNFVGSGGTLKDAKINLIRQLEDADTPVLTIPILPEFQHPN